MRNLSKLMLTLALVFGAVGGVNAKKLYADLSTLENGPSSTWNAYTNTITWTQQSNNMISNFDFAAGDYTLYDKIVVDVSNLNNAIGIRVQIKANGEEKYVALNGEGVFEKTLTTDFGFTAADLKNVEWIRLLGSGYYDGENHTINVDNPASAKINSVYLESTEKTSEVDLSTLPASSENTTWSWDAETSTGTFTWTATSWNSTELFGSGNYSAYTTLNLVTATGSENHFRIIFQFTNGASQVTISPVATGTVSINLADYVSTTNLANVNTIRLSGANDETGYITVSRVYLEGPNVTYIEATPVYEAPAGTTALNDIAGSYTALKIEYPKEVKGQAATLFGDGDGSTEAGHATITDYDYLCFEITKVSGGSSDLRVWVWDGTKVVTLRPHPIADYANVTDWTAGYSILTPGTYAVNISNYDYLKGAKTNWGSSATMTISMAYLSKGSAPAPYVPSGKYTLVGEATGSVTLTEALADDAATCYDATGVTGTGVELTPINPNALFIANAGALANTANVIVDGTCANLELVDGKPFKAPAAFTATAAKFSKSVSDAGYATMVIPFAASLPSGVDAKELTAVSDEKITSNSVDAISADAPVMIKAEAGDYEFTAANASIAATADGEVSNGLLYGGYATMTADVDAGNYVLQNTNDGVNFYMVTGTAATVKPFRAYLKAQSNGARLFFDFNDDQTTGITGIEDASLKTEENIFNLNGQRVSKPTKGMYIVNGKKMLMK